MELVCEGRFTVWAMRDSDGKCQMYDLLRDLIAGRRFSPARDALQAFKELVSVVGPYYYPHLCEDLRHGLESGQIR